MSQNQKLMLKIIAGIVFCELAGALVGMSISQSAREWYPTLLKPNKIFYIIPWPSSQLFGVVWTILYAMMGASLGILWDELGKKPLAKTSLIWFGVQFVLNLMWPLVFFGMRNTGRGYAVMFFLWMAIVGLLWVSSKTNKLAFYLLVPYFLWVTFASSLNFSLFSLNVMKPGAAKMDADPKNGFPDRKAPRLKEKGE